MALLALPFHILRVEDPCALVLSLHVLQSETRSTVGRNGGIRDIRDKADFELEMSFVHPTRGTFPCWLNILSIATHEKPERT
jgi:hypothetical protein